MGEEIAERLEYESTPFRLADTAPDPLVQFERWFSDATAAEVDQPTAMVLSTSSTEGVPNSRAVLLKGFGADGFVFYTNLESAKGEEIATNPIVALLFLWLPLHRQVRIVGEAGRVDAATADEYFASRPLGARIGAVASPQSSVIPSRAWLEQRVAELETQGESIERPDHWGGYVVRPSSFEFWQGQRDRLHDRISYRLERGEWVRIRLAP